ncbi:acetyl-CoA C-acyltransferase [Paenibacillus sacheonensis]|uniref:acetyl-CoA C-acetyltransferase n=1 Tax=Paenibacillus sacheonensis TaxID=742054 RepID=A0A7X4YLB6_9BACL|nr:acetyl-CoA C-acetyltransferase [Paenibacillus sacheonensis]NBC68495.1 acetyl-CoA C-acyltransferase [Paenibacillus sacheonensis]
MSETVIIGSARTPFGKFGGALKGRTAAELGGIALQGALQRSGLASSSVDEVIMGMAIQAGAGQNPARQAALHAGFGAEIPAETVNKVCASGLRSITMGAQIIAAGDAEIIAAGGMESMSGVPHALRDYRFGRRMGDGAAADLMLGDGLRCAAGGGHMGDYADSLAASYGISRTEQDEWALRSHERAVQGILHRIFETEIVPVPLADGTPAASHVFAVDTDEPPRGDTSMEKLAALRPIFNAGGAAAGAVSISGAGSGAGSSPGAGAFAESGAGRGTITAGNAPGVNDGAAAVIVASQARALREGWAPLATIIGHAAISVEPHLYPIAPALAVQKLLRREGLQLDAVDRIELNEAFAAVVLACGKLLGWDADKVNVHGGAIALGHPVGASGARIVVTLINGLRRRGGGLGIAAICSGGGQGDALLIKVEG